MTDMVKLRKISKKTNSIVEDACQSILGAIKRKMQEHGVNSERFSSSTKKYKCLV